MAFIKNGFDDWKHGLEKFLRHEKTNCHQLAVELLETRRKQDNSHNSINKQIETLRATTVTKNREYLRHIIQTLWFLAKQNISLRGHYESSCSTNRGNFLEMLELRKAEVDILNQTFKTNYTSHEIQNEIIDLIGIQIREFILTECNDRPFSIIVDETPDISNDEQVSLCIRYVDDAFNIRERFLGFYKAGTFHFAT